MWFNVLQGLKVTSGQNVAIFDVKDVKYQSQRSSALCVYVTSSNVSNSVCFCSNSVWIRDSVRGVVPSGTAVCSPQQHYRNTSGWQEVCGWASTSRCSPSQRHWSVFTVHIRRHDNCSLRDIKVWHDFQTSHHDLRLDIFTGIWYNILRGVAKVAVIVNVRRHMCFHWSFVARKTGNHFTPNNCYQPQQMLGPIDVNILRFHLIYHEHVFSNV